LPRCWNWFTGATITKKKRKDNKRKKGLILANKKSMASHGFLVFFRLI